MTHKTGRVCEEKGCNGDLLGTTVAFGESLPEKELEKAVKHSQKADLCLIMGTSMRVTPACELPFYNEKSKIVIVNLQITPFDKHSDIRSFSKTDDFMKLLMNELKLNEFDMKFDGNKILKESFIKPKKECTHLDDQIDSFSSEILEKKASQGCSICKDVKLKMMCLKCSELDCWEHIKSHFKKSGHCLAIRMSDFAFWCEKCNDFIDNSEFIQF